MRQHVNVAIILIALLIPSTQCIGSAASPKPQASSQLATREEAVTSQKSSQEEPPISYADFSNFSLATPKKAVVSFIELYNGILPASPEADITSICAKSTHSSYYTPCIDILTKRLLYLKSIARNLQGAHFHYQQISQPSEKPIEFKTQWEEKLSFFDGSTKITPTTMMITLEKSGNEWKIIRISSPNE